MTRSSVGVEDTGPASFEELRVRDCSIRRTLDVIGEKWTLLVLREAIYGARPPRGNRNSSALVIRAGTEPQSLDALADGRWRDLKPLGRAIEGDELDDRCDCGQLLSKPG